MRQSSVLEFLKISITHGETVALIGPPGCGKSSLMDQACQATKRELITSVPSVEDPTEPGGFPWIAEDRSHAVKVLFGQAYRAVHAKKPAVWFWDDFGQANPSVQAGYMQWALAREMNGQRLPDHVTIALATNRRTDRAGVSGILEPVKGRFTLVNVESNVDDFCMDLIRRGQRVYGLNEDTIALGCAFIRFRPELLNAFAATVDLANSPTERNWVCAFRHIQRKMPPQIELEAVRGRVGGGAAAELIGFVRVYRELPSLDAILLDPDKAPVPDSPAALYAVSIGLASRVTEGNFKRVARYAERLCEKGKAEFGVLLVKDAVRRNPRLANTTVYIEIAADSAIGRLITGEEA